MRFSAYRVYTSTFQLLDDEGRQFSVHCRLCCAIDARKHGSGKCQALFQGETAAIDVCTGLVAVIEVPGIDQNDFFKAVAFPVIRHLFIVMK